MAAKRIVSGPVSTRRSLPISLLRTREAVMQRFRPHLLEFGFTEQQWRVLRVLGETGSMDAGDLAERACILPSSLSRILKTMVSAKLIATEPHAIDGRCTIVNLASGGERVLKKALPGSAAIYAALEEEIGAAQLKKLLDLLEKVQARLQ